MRSMRTRDGWVLRFDAGEELYEGLREFAREQGIRGGSFTGIGAVGEAELGFFHRTTRSYDRRVFEGEHEMLALIGNISVLEGEPFPHAHLTIAGPDFVAYGGHLFRAVVTVTAEVTLQVSPEPVPRTSRPDLGFHPLTLGERD